MANDSQQTLAEDSVTAASVEPDTDDKDKIDFQGAFKKVGLGISVSAVGGAVIYAFGVIIVIAVLAAAVLALGVFLKYK